MRKGLDVGLAIGSIAIITIVPTVLILLPSGKDDPGDKGPLPDPAAAQLNGPVMQPPTPPASSPAPPPSTSGQQQPSAGDNPLPQLPGGGSEPALLPKPNGYAPASTGAKITKLKWLDKGKSAFLATVESPALGRKSDFRVIVPKGWDRRSPKTWPSLYAFHGGNDGSQSWMRSTDIAKVAAKYDTLVVMPDGGRTGSYVNWFNRGAGGPPKWEEYHTVEVRELMERNFRAGGARAAIGISSGAQGAMTYAARQPGLFSYVGAFSGALSILSPGMPSLLRATNSSSDVDINDIWGDPIMNRANWMAHDPATLVSRLKGTKLHVSAGTGGPDNPGEGEAPWDIRYLSEAAVGYSTREFVKAAEKAKVEVSTHLYEKGAHQWSYWKREMHTVFPYAMASINAPRH